MSKQKVFFVHGWSVRSTQTYQALHLKLAEYGFDLQNIHLGRYVSLEDKIEICDISKAFHHAVDKELGGDWNKPFNIITHSTGGLVIKDWLVRYYIGKYALNKPAQNIVHLAAPHFGSRLAHHGRSMLGQVMELGETGKKVLNALELASDFNWDVNGRFFDDNHWKNKGVRIYNLIGDRVKKDFFKYKIFPAAFEQGSDMVVRVASGNLNFKRFLLDGKTGDFSLVGEVKGIPFGALYEYTHSNSDYGILNNIKKNSTPQKQLNLKLILECLNVQNDDGLVEVNKSLVKATKETRQKRQGFAQLDFRFRDEEGMPVDDYVVTLGAIVKGVRRPSKTIVHTHKNKICPNQFMVFVNLKELEPQLPYFIDFNSDSNSKLFSYEPDPLEIKASPGSIKEIIEQDQTTQIDVILSRIPSENLFVFHRGDDNQLHVNWNRDGKIVKKKRRTK
jgi:hypothetical protein